MSGTKDSGRLGVLILDTRFPRLVGDIGNPASFDFPVLYETLIGVSPQMAVRDAPGTPALLDTLVVAADRLVARGATAISTSCGFLALFQRELALRFAVPVATSSLLVVPEIARRLKPGQRVGIITAEAPSLSPAHLAAVDVPADTPIEGMAPGGAFARTFLDNAPTLDARAVEAETIAAGRRLLARHAEIGAIVLECTNLPPYAAALRAALGLPVYDVGDLVRALMAR